MNAPYYRDALSTVRKSVLLFLGTLLGFVTQALTATEVVGQNRNDKKAKKKQGAIVFFNDKKVACKRHANDDAC